MTAVRPSRPIAALTLVIAAGCGPGAEAGAPRAGWIVAEPPSVRLVGAETATVTLRARPPVRLTAELSAPGIRVARLGGAPPAWVVGPEGATARFSIEEAAAGYIEGHWRLRARSSDLALEVPIRATTDPGPRLRPAGPVALDVGRGPLDAVVTWRLRNEGGATAPLRVREVGGPARLLGPTERAIGALTATTVAVQLALEAPGAFEVWARVQSGTSTIDLQAVGEAVAPALNARPAGLDFGMLVVGGESTRDVALANGGGGSLRVDAVDLSPGAESAFRWAWTGVDRPASASGPWWIGARPLEARVTFAPETPGPYARELRVSHAEGVTVIPLRGSARSCAAACSIPRARATCSNGRCFLERCEPGYFDANGSVDDGCECADLDDAGSTCATAVDLGRIEEQSAPRVIHGRLPSGSDVDLVRFHADDGFHVFQERFDVRIELQSEGPDVELCVFRRPTDEPRPECLLRDPRCPADRRVRYEGSYGREDAADFVVRIRSGDASARACTPYRLIVRNG